MLAKPSEQLASDYLWCHDAEEENADFPARAIEDHECGEPTCCDLYERLAACTEFIARRDRRNWASCGESDPEMDEIKIREYRILMAVVDLRLETQENEHIGK